MTPTIDALYIYDIDAKKDVRKLNVLPTLYLDEPLYLDELPKKFTIRAACTGAKSVRFSLNTQIQVENKEPYNCQGDDKPVMGVVGNYTFAARPFAGTGATGESGNPINIFNIVVAASRTKIIKGINYFNEVGFAGFDAFAKPANVKAIRTWQCVRPDRLPTVQDFHWYKPYKAAGYKIINVCTIAEKGQHGDLPTASQTAAWFSTAAKLSGGLVDGWEVGNEPNLANYWPGTLTEFMDRFMKPAYEALKGKGQIVYGASVAENTDRLKDLVNLGYCNYCDYASHHPYTTDVQKHIGNVARAKQLVGSKPLALTEWNIHGYWNNPKLTAQQWADSLPLMLEGIRPYVSEAYYFQFTKNNSAGGVAGIWDKTTKQPIEPFWSAVTGLNF
jgi:hypothetical protein